MTSRARRSTRGGRSPTIDAISYALTRPETDGRRIGVWGSSYSGAHVLVLGATDRRIKCVASQVPLISGYRNARRLIRADVIAAVEAMCAEDRLKRYRGEPPPATCRWFPRIRPAPRRCRRRTSAVVHGNRQGAGVCLAERRDAALGRAVHGLRAGRHIELISPTPLLMVVALGDHLTVADEALAAYERARQPKKLVMLKGGHFDAYVADFDAASGAARLVPRASGRFEGAAR